MRTDRSTPHRPPAARRIAAAAVVTAAVTAATTLLALHRGPEATPVTLPASFIDDLADEDAVAPPPQPPAPLDLRLLTQAPGAAGHRG